MKFGLLRSCARVASRATLRGVPRGLCATLGVCAACAGKSRPLTPCSVRGTPCCGWFGYFRIRPFHVQRCFMCRAGLCGAAGFCPGCLMLWVDRLVQVLRWWRWAPLWQAARLHHARHGEGQRDDWRVPRCRQRWRQRWRKWWRGRQRRGGGGSCDGGDCASPFPG